MSPGITDPSPQRLGEARGGRRVQPGCQGRVQPFSWVLPPHSLAAGPAALPEQPAGNERPQLIPGELAGVSGRASGRWQILLIVEEWKIISVRTRSWRLVINGAW
jgi:hypothetical protein